MDMKRGWQTLLKAYFDYVILILICVLLAKSVTRIESLETISNLGIFKSQDCYVSM